MKICWIRAQAPWRVLALAKQLGGKAGRGAAQAVVAMPLEPFTQITRWIEGLARIPAWANP